MPAGLQKLRVLAQVAYVFCMGATKQANKDIADEAANAARAVPAVAAKPYERVIIAQTAAEAITVCNGAEAAKAFVAEIAPSDLVVQVLSKLADKLTNTQQIDLARAIAPPPDPTNAGDLLDSANRLKKQGDRLAAIRLALAASQLAVGVQRGPAEPLYKWLDHTVLLGRIFGTLAELGAYDDAIATVQPIEIQNRQQYYDNIVRVEVQHKDSAAIARTLPLAIATIRLPTPAGRSANLLYELTRTLAAGGYSDEAKVAYESLLELLGTHPATPQDRVQPWQLAALKADLGDLAGAMSDADNAGPMVTKPSFMQAVMLTAMQFGGARTKPSEAEVQAALQRSIQALPPFVAGPKASALSMIAVEMAAQGKFDAALQVASKLDVEPREVLQSTRNVALAAIAKAQEKAGDLRGSFSTVLQIAQPLSRWDTLLKLAAQPVKS
jgi:tetratricopeptide (TPR) repeat protein